VVPAGIAPLAVEVKVVSVPLGQAEDELELKHIAYRVFGAYPVPDKVTVIPFGP